jgi:hypothetical protein
MRNESIDRVDTILNRLGASLFLDSTTIDVARRSGVDDVVALIFGGRIGAMGDVGEAEMIEAFAFVSPTFLSATWASIDALGGPAALLPIFLASNTEAARANWDLAALGAVGSVAREVIEPVEGIRPGLFTGWRNLALDSEDGGLSQDVASLHALRELRGDIHIDSVRLEGLSPLEAEIATRGPVVAELHGWPQPYPDAAQYQQRSLAAARRTSDKMVEIYDASIDRRRFDELADAAERLTDTQR